ncbi:DUF6082 family protein [Amycolatopsis sp. cmx-4-68]|uniref:DUF6082 family protein n=1 Tax=Amycolatopsis sp. cmx-4-68 TaxID=2790938 RepID=UPI00397D7FE3
MLFPLVDHVEGLDWSKLSDIGQAYGGVSALISTVGLFGIAASLLGQVRESRRSGIRDERQLHSEILLFAIEHPEYLQCWGTPPVRGGAKATSYRSFCNLVFLNYYSMYLSGQYDLDGIRRNIRHFFGGELGREYWRSAQPSWSGSKNKGRSRRKFLTVVEEEFLRAEAAGPPTPWVRSGVEEPASREREIRNPDTTSGGWPTLALTLSGLAVGMAGGWLVRRREHGHERTHPT